MTTNYKPQITTEERHNMHGDVISIETRKATLRVIIRKDTPSNASVLEARGVQVELVRHLNTLWTKYPQITAMKNQAHNIDEIKAMYKAGFRCRDAERIGMEETIKLARNDGECLFWER